MNIVLCDKGLNGEVPSYQFDDNRKAIDFIHEWLETKDFEKSVFVCFANYRQLPVEKLRDEQNSILVSHSWDDITDMVESYLDAREYDKMDFAIFEYESYYDAFGYCIDLRESF